MATHQKVAKGFVKTENAILLMVAALALGFVGGVVFSAYRSSTQMTAGGPGAAMPNATLNAQQLATRDALLQKTRDNANDARAWIQLGHFYFDSGDHDKALESYETARDIDDTSPDVWTDLGVMYRRSDQPQKAVDCFNRALTLDPTHEIAMFNKGIVLMHDLQDAQGALESWKLLVQVNPDARTPNGLAVKEMIAELMKTINTQGE
jgi:cytochrome c-type biogenesis protein CcmH/NrfG